MSVIDHKNALPAGRQLQEYSIKSVLGHGGFGITYLAYDNILNRFVAIKEYLPQDLAIRKDDTAVVIKSNSNEDRRLYRWGLKCFVSEAKNLAKFKHPNIVRVLRFIEANNSAYLVMDYERGQTLKDYIETQRYGLPEKELKSIFLPVIEGLCAVHKIGLLHRDIKPSNIYLRENSTPMLIDFGSARMALGEKSRSLNVVVTPGYAPYEQYSSKGNQGPWTDVYGVGASLYVCITGRVVPDANDRSLAILNNEPDPYQTIRTVTSGNYSDAFLAGIDWALKFHIKDRPQTGLALLKQLTGTVAAEDTAKQDDTVAIPYRLDDAEKTKNSPTGFDSNLSGMSVDSQKNTPQGAKEDNLGSAFHVRVSWLWLTFLPTLWSGFFWLMRQLLEGLIAFRQLVHRYYWVRTPVIRTVKLIFQAIGNILGFILKSFHYFFLFIIKLITSIIRAIYKTIKFIVWDSRILIPVFLLFILWEQLLYIEAIERKSELHYQNYLNTCLLCIDEPRVNKLQAKQRQDSDLFNKVQLKDTQSAYEHYLIFCELCVHRKIAQIKRLRFSILDGIQKRLGIVISEPSSGQPGVIVKTVISGGPAFDAGIKKGDIILRIGNEDIGPYKFDIVSLLRFNELVKDLPAGKAIYVLIDRDGSPLFIAMKLDDTF